MDTRTPDSADRRRLLQHVAAAAGMLVPGLGAFAHEQHHHIGSNAEGYLRRTGDYTIPDLELVDAQGTSQKLRARLADQPVILNFIFTTCDTICPVSSQIFSQVQEALGAERNPVQLISISIDPETDTPAALKAYGAKFGAGPHWKMLTGRVADSIAVQRAFDAYRGDKMNHQPSTFLRARPGLPWLRLDGFASALDIVREYRQLASATAGTS